MSIRSKLAWFLNAGLNIFMGLLFIFGAQGDLKIYIFGVCLLLSGFDSCYLLFSKNDKL
jgi:hypothetical protein